MPGKSRPPCPSVGSVGTTENMYPVPELTWQSELVVLLLPLAAFYWWATGRGRLNDTTLVAPIRWGFIAFLALGYSAASRFGGSPYLAYVIAVLMIAPTLALLGAKRPQNGAWQFIVLTLVGVLLLPVMQGLAFGDPRPHVHALFRWLIAAHIVVGVVNYLPTMFAGPACCFGAAQACAARDLLPFPLGNTNLSDVALLLFCAALIGVRILAFRRAKNGVGLHRLWFDFRDAYGLVWGLRIAERLNAVAVKQGWPVEFGWSAIRLRRLSYQAIAPVSGAAVETRSGTGLLNCPVPDAVDTPSDVLLSPLPADLRHRIERELRSHLRRFVSHDWIARRLHNEPRPSGSGTLATRNPAP
jgi:hypothetical protein